MKYAWPGRLVLAVIPVVLSAGCAPNLQQLESEALLPEIDIVQLKENSDEALKLAQEAKLNVQVVNTRLTELDNQLVVLSEEVSAVSLAKIEEIENRLALLIEAYKDLYEQVSALEVLPRVRSNPKKKAAPPTFSPSSAAALLTSTEYSEYNNALDLFDSGEYKTAIKEFGALLKKYPDGKYAGNAVYWIGECYYGLRDYANAVRAFERVLEKPTSPKSDDAQLKLGLSYLKMGQRANAGAELRKLIDRYPNSEYVPRSKKYLNTLN